MTAAAATNPWPCIRCSSPITVAARAGRLPRNTALAALIASVMLWVGLVAWYPGEMGRWALSVLALMGIIVLGLLRAARTAWRCPRCGYRQRARARHAGPVAAAVCVPTYDNAASIAEVVRGCIEHAPQLPLIVVDDGSSDATGEIARRTIETHQGERAPPRVVVRLPRNRGKGAALVTGLQRAATWGRSHLITLDGDGQHRPSDIPALLRAVAARPAAIVVGARDLSNDNVETSSRFGRAFSNFWLRVQTGTRIPDSQSGFRAYPVAPTLSLGLRARRYDFEVEVLTVAARAGIELTSTPIDVHYPPPSERVSHFDKLWDNVRISLLNTRLLVAALLWPLGWPARLSHAEPPSAVPRSWTGKSRGGALGHMIFVWILRLLGPTPAYLLLRPVSLYFVLAARKNLAAVRGYFERVLGRAGPLGRTLRAYRQTLVFARCILDRAVVMVRGPDAFSMRQEGHAHLAGQIESGRGAVILSAHLGNYEVAGSLLKSTERAARIRIVMLDTEVEAIRKVYERIGQTDRMPEVIAINKSEYPALAILKALRAGELVAMHGDRIIDGNWVWCDFLGDRAPFPTNPYTIAAAARVPVILTFGFHDGGRTYRFIAEPPRIIELPREGRQEALARHAQWYADRLEHWTRVYPYQWFNFYDFWEAPGPSG